MTTAEILNKLDKKELKEFLEDSHIITDELSIEIIKHVTDVEVKK